MADDHRCDEPKVDALEDYEQLTITSTKRRRIARDPFLNVIAEPLRADAFQSSHPHGRDSATQDGANRDLDGRADTSPEPYYGNALGSNTNTPSKSHIRVDDDLTDYSDPEYQDDPGDISNSEADFDSECEFVEERSVRVDKERSTLTKPVKRHPDAPKVSKLHVKRQELEKKGIFLDKNGTRKGVVRGEPNNNNLDFWDHNEWKPAVYHYQIRGKLLQVTDLNGKYDVEPTSGVDPLDRTAFKVEHKHFKFNTRDQRPEILFQWNQTEEPSDTLPGIWYDSERIILSIDNHPLRKFPELPLTLSGRCEGMRLETFKRMNPNISMNELKARMPPQTCKGSGLAVRAIQTPALANRMARDRIRIGAKAWTAKQGSNQIERRLLQTIPENIQREIIRSNSTRCHRDLTEAELQYVEAANRGNAENLAKAGPRRLDEDTRRKREAEMQKRMEKKGVEVKLHTVVDEALEGRPALVSGTKQGSRINAPSSGDMAPVKIEEGGEVEDPRPSHIHVRFVEVPKRSASPVSQAPIKRQKRTHIGNADNISGNEERSGFAPMRKPSSSSNGAPAAPDFRHTKPKSDRERFQIQAALNLSHDDYERYVGFPPVIRTNRNASYAYQLGQLQVSLDLQVGDDISAPNLKSWGPVGSFGELSNLASVRHKSSGGIAKGEQHLGVPEGVLGDMEGDTLVE